MGIFRKTNSILSLGAVHYRTSNQKTARNTKRINKSVRASNAIEMAMWRQQQAQAAQDAAYQQIHLNYLASQQRAAPGWYHCQTDPPNRLRWWNGGAWTTDTMIPPPTY